ncbi:MAG: YkgJ family cysteine cluster protein [Chitinispirillaceae bacterium]
MKETVNNSCENCNAHCCRHIAVGIDTPRNKRDYDDIRWYLLHQNVWVSIDHEGSWLLEFRTPCRHIREDFTCAIYKERPRICKEYPAENQLCEGETDEPSYTELFKCAEDLEKYIRRKKPFRKAGKI